LQPRRGGLAPLDGALRGVVVRVRVFVMSKHGVLRGGLCALINLQPEMEAVGEAANGADAEIGIEATEPDVVLMDISTPHGEGLAAIAAIKRIRPEMRIIVLTVQDELGHLRAARRAGASGYIVKRAVDTELLAAIRAVAQGGTFMDASVGMELAQNSMWSNPIDAERGRGMAQLTPRELEVMRRVAEGFTNAQIAKELWVGIKSIETYRARAMAKLGLASRAALVRLAIDCGLLGSRAPVA
jgi:two-component system response regulator NreC